MERSGADEREHIKTNNHFWNIRMTINATKFLIEMCWTTDTTYIGIYSLYVRYFFRSVIFFPHTYRYHTPIPKSWYGSAIKIIRRDRWVHSDDCRICSAGIPQYPLLCSPSWFIINTTVIYNSSSCGQRSLCADQQPVLQNIPTPRHSRIPSLGKMRSHPWHNSLWSIDRQTAQI